MKSYDGRSILRRPQSRRRLSSHRTFESIKNIQYWLLLTSQFNLCNSVLRSLCTCYRDTKIPSMTMMMMMKMMMTITTTLRYVESSYILAHLQHAVCSRAGYSNQQCCGCGCGYTQSTATSHLAHPLHATPLTDWSQRILHFYVCGCLLQLNTERST